MFSRLTELHSTCSLLELFALKRDVDLDVPPAGKELTEPLTLGD